MDCKIALSDIITWGLTILGFAIAICQFRSQMTKDRENRVKENKTTWFLNVIVLPHLEGLHKFYKELSENVQSESKELDNYTTREHKVFLEQKGKTINSLKNDISDYFDFLNPLIISHSNSLGKEIQQIKNDLEDDIAKFFDTEDRSLDLISIKINNNKQQLLQALNRELSVNK